MLVGIGGVMMSSEVGIGGILEGGGVVCLGGGFFYCSGGGV